MRTPTALRRLLPAILLVTLRVNAAAPAQFYVAPDGSDQWSGRLAAPAADRTDGPFASPERARAAVRAVDRSAGAIVIVRGGTYLRRHTLELGAADSGTAGHPVVWQAAAGERPVFSGAMVVPELAPVTDAAIHRRLAPAARAHVFCANLRALGITDFGRIEQRGSPGLELFFRGRRMPLARYPNTGWLRIASVPQTGAHRYYDGVAREIRFDDGIPAGRNYGRIRIDDPRPRRWAPADDIYAHGYWTFDWSDSYQRIESFDPKTLEVTFAAPHSPYGYTRNQRFYFLNVLEELDAPGEWYLDRTSGELYFYPPDPPRPGDVQVSVLDEPFVRVEDAHDIQVDGFTFAENRAGGIVIHGSDACAVRGCTFRNLGALAAGIDGGANDEIRSCDFSELANGAIKVAGGDRVSLVASHHQIINNHIHDFDQWLRAGDVGITIDGVGQHVAHNDIHDAPFEAIRLSGNDHMIEYNEVYRIAQETGDSGALHTGRDWTFQGNVIRYNYWHDLKGPGLHGATAVYLDDFSSGFSVIGNIFYRASRAVQIGGGRDNTVVGNLFIDCEPSVHLDARGLGWAANYFDGRYPYLFDRFRELHADRPPYATRYPKLATLLSDQPAYPKGNRVVGNISWGGRWLDVYDYFAFDFRRCVVMQDNVIADPGLWRRRARADGHPDPYYLNIDMREGYVLLRNDDPAARAELAGNTIETAAPGSFNPVTLAFTPHDPHAAALVAEHPIPVGQIGLVRDEWRTTVPSRQPIP
ncbi:MAG TPA: right-handed parallel beta-helix repeat-containing protein [Opitutaceae bacterium]|nr:right-handed parallel beta-helix repeat-containing protein [Opitutaceae bacterium]